MPPHKFDPDSTDAVIATIISNQKAAAETIADLAKSFADVQRDVAELKRIGYLMCGGCFVVGLIIKALMAILFK